MKEKSEEQLMKDQEELMERNGKVVSSFMEHCKNEGLEIPDSFYESFFGA